MMSLRWNDNTVMRGRLADVMINLACRDCVDEARILSVSGVQTSKMRVEGLALGSTYSLYDLMGNWAHRKSSVAGAAHPISQIS